jgi:undecaprenyl-phosphate 4-deoxy-4-formamido-L-arabinose transferase
MSKVIELSIIIPVYNEAENLSPLFQRLTHTLDNEGLAYEILFTNDGSQDESLAHLKGFFQIRPDVVRIIDFQGNFGQHMAIMAAFEQARGHIMVTLDADLQNPPEEIPKLLAKMKEGFDCVGSYRSNRQDNFFRTYVSRLVNWFRESTTDIKMRDQGCMLRAYSRQIVDQIVKSGEQSTFIPALAYKFSFNPTEVEVKHDARAAGTSKYNLYRLIRLNFDLITGFSLLPLQIFTLFGMAVSGLSGLLVAYMLLRRLFVGPEAEGLFTLFAILIFLVSVVITGIGIIGEYLGRIFLTLSNRPRYIIREMIEKK